MSSAAVTPAALRRSRAGATRSSRRATTARRRLSCIACRRSRGAVSISERALVGAPMPLEVGHQRRTEVAERLLARVERHVGAKDVARLLAGAQRPPVGG